MPVSFPSLGLTTVLLLSPRHCNDLPVGLPLYTPVRLFCLQCPLLRRRGFRSERTVCLETLTDASHLRLHNTRDVVVAVLRNLDEDVVEVGEELGYSRHGCLLGVSVPKCRSARVWLDGVCDSNLVLCGEARVSREVVWSRARLELHVRSCKRISLCEVQCPVFKNECQRAFDFSQRLHVHDRGYPRKE